MKRIEKRGEKQFFEKMETLKQVGENYQNAVDFLAKKDQRYFVTLDANQPLESVERETITALEKYLKKNNF